MKTKKEKIFNPDNLSRMASYMDSTYQTLYFYRKEKPKKFELLLLGWKAKCEHELHPQKD